MSEIGSLSPTGQTLTTLVDEVTATLTYVGKAAPGSLTTQAAWQIKKIEIVGTITSIKLVNGATSFNQIWDNRATLTYT